MAEAETRWSPALRVAFRFSVCFFTITTLYLAIGHLSGLLPFLRPVAETIQDRGLFAAYQWGTERLFGNVVYATGAGFLAYMSTALLGAGIATLLWSLLDRRRTNYRRAYAALRIYLRYLLAAVALSYGATKVIPVQFLPPSLVALITPLGEFTRMRLLWHFMGTSTAYIVFTGLVEVTGGLLLFWRRTTPLGALILAAAFSNVALLNFGYEVGVQLNSTIYVLMALVLLAPDGRRLAQAFLERPVEGHGGTHRTGNLVKAVVIVLLIAVNFRQAYQGRRDLVRRPALYGIYDVVEFKRDGVPVPPGDSLRWPRVIVAERGAGAIQWTAGGRVDQYSVKEDSSTGVLALTPSGPRQHGADAALRPTGGRSAGPRRRFSRASGPGTTPRRGRDEAPPALASTLTGTARRVPGHQPRKVRVTMSSTNLKKSLLLLAITSWVVIEGCKAPPITISQSQIEAVFAVGSTFRLFWDSTSQSVNVGGTGGPNTYDFRNLPFVPYDSVTMLAASQIPQLATRFPSNALTSNEEGNTVYPVFSFSNHGFNRHGRVRIVSATTEWYQHIIPADQWLRFPVTLNSQFSQANTVVVDTTYVSGVPTKTSADTSSDTKYVDGYGTLLLPGGLAFKCLRIRVVSSFPKTSKGFHFWTREGAVILIDSDTSQPDTGVVKRGYVIYFSPQTRNPGTRD